jgi:TPR repeat protein
MPMHLHLIKCTHSTSLNHMTREDQLRVAKDCVETGHNLVWDKKDYEQAVKVLQKALKLFQNLHGKHHRDVGNTCNYIGTAYWLQHKLGLALKYFFEARRIYCKAGQGSIKGVDDRIHCILRQLRFDDEEIEDYELAILRAMEHELQGDRLKESGFRAQAKQEYIQARYHFATLKTLIA